MSLIFPPKNYSKLSHKELVKTQQGISQVGKEISNLSGQMNSMATGIKALSSKQEVTNRLLDYNNQIALETNENLQTIDNSLNKIGFVLTDIYSSARKQNELTAEQNRKLDKHTEILGEQTDLLKVAAGSLERQEAMKREEFLERKKENELKEVLYNVKKYLELCKKIEDPLSASYGTKQLLNTIKSRNFSTKDLSNIADKEFFDSRLDEGNEILKSLSEQQKNELYDFEITYAGYSDLKNFNVEEYISSSFPVPKPLIPLDLSGIKLQKPIPPKKEIIEKPYPTIKFEKSDKTFSKYEIEELLSWYTKNGKILKYIFLWSLPIWFILMIIFAIADAQGAMVGLISVVEIFVVIYGIYAFLKRIGRITKFALLYGVTKKDFQKKLDEYSKEVNIYNAENEAFIQSQEASYQDELKKYQDRLKQYEIEYKEIEKQKKEENEKQNEEIIKFNEKDEKEKEMIRNNHYSMLEEMKKVINSFLDAHPLMLKFLPKV